MTFAAFEHQMGRLSGLRFRPAELQTHWEALKDIPDAVLEAAVTRAQRSRVEFPTPVELRQDADQVAFHAAPLEPAEDRSVPLTEPFTITVPEVGTVVSVTREWRYYCETCSDGGWESIWCGEITNGRKPWQALRHCDRSGAHAHHEWVRKCACYDTNQALVRKREAAQKYAEKPGRAA